MPTNMWIDRHGNRTALYGKGSQWRLSAPGPDGNKPITQMFSGSKVAAEKAEQRWRAEIEEGRGLDRKASEMTIAAYSVPFRASRSWRPGTRRRMNLDWDNYIIPLVGHLRLKNVRKIHMETWALRLEEKGLSARTRKHAIISLYGMFKSAKDNGAMSGPNPFDGVPRPSVKSGEYWLPAPAVFQALIDNLPERYRLVAALAGGCGLRNGEIMGLTTDDVIEDIKGGMRIYVRHQLANPDDDTAHLAPAKTEASVRTVPVPRSVVPMLRDHLAHADWLTTMDIEDRSGDRAKGAWPTRTVTLLFGQSGRPMSKNVWGKTWRVARAATPGLNPAFTLHGLRHLYITSLILAGRSGPAVQVLAGHGNLTTTLGTYAHYFKLMDAKADDTAPLEVLFAPAALAAA